jgi:hypothetical protein
MSDETTQYFDWADRLRSQLDALDTYTLAEPELPDAEFQKAMNLDEAINDHLTDAMGLIDDLCQIRPAATTNPTEQDGAA